jgi:hypothetical protein
MKEGMKPGVWFGGDCEVSYVCLEADGRDICIAEEMTRLKAAKRAKKVLEKMLRKVEKELEAAA